MAVTSHGKAWEGRLQAWHEAYRRRGVGLIVKTEPRVKVLSRPTRQGHFRACWAGKGPVDFVGIAKGRAVFFDAKATTQDRWSFSDLATHQAVQLGKAQDAGAVAFLALRCPHGEFLVPWHAIRDAWLQWRAGKASRGGASLGKEDIEKIGRRMDGEGWLCCL